LLVPSRNLVCPAGGKNLIEDIDGITIFQIAQESNQVHNPLQVVAKLLRSREDAQERSPFLVGRRFKRYRLRVGRRLGLPPTTEEISPYVCHAHAANPRIHPSAHVGRLESWVRRFHNAIPFLTRSMRARSDATEKTLTRGMAIRTDFRLTVGGN